MVNQRRTPMIQPLSILLSSQFATEILLHNRGQSMVSWPLMDLIYLLVEDALDETQSITLQTLVENNPILLSPIYITHEQHKIVRNTYNNRILNVFRQQSELVRVLLKEAHNNPIVNGRELQALIDSGVNSTNQPLVEKTQTQFPRVQIQLSKWQQILPGHKDIYGFNERVELYGHAVESDFEYINLIQNKEWVQHVSSPHLSQVQQQTFSYRSIQPLRQMLNYNVRRKSNLSAYAKLYVRNELVTSSESFPLEMDDSDVLKNQPERKLLFKIFNRILGNREKKGRENSEKEVTKPETINREMEANRYYNRWSPVQLLSVIEQSSPITQYINQSSIRFVHRSYTAYKQALFYTALNQSIQSLNGYQRHRPVKRRPYDFTGGNMEKSTDKDASGDITNNIARTATINTNTNMDIKAKLNENANINISVNVNINNSIKKGLLNHQISHRDSSFNEMDTSLAKMVTSSLKDTDIRNYSYVNQDLMDIDVHLKAVKADEYINHRALNHAFLYTRPHVTINDLKLFGSNTYSPFFRHMSFSKEQQKAYEKRMNAMLQYKIIDEQMTDMYINSVPMNNRHVNNRHMNNMHLSNMHMNNMPMNNRHVNNTHMNYMHMSNMEAETYNKSSTVLAQTNGQMNRIQDQTYFNWKNQNVSQNVNQNDSTVSEMLGDLFERATQKFEIHMKRKTSLEIYQSLYNGLQNSYQSAMKHILLTHMATAYEIDQIFAGINRVSGSEYNQPLEAYTEIDLVVNRAESRSSTEYNLPSMPADRLNKKERLNQIERINEVERLSQIYRINEVERNVQSKVASPFKQINSVTTESPVAAIHQSAFLNADIPVDSATKANDIEFMSTTEYRLSSESIKAFNPLYIKNSREVNQLLQKKDSFALAIINQIFSIGDSPLVNTVMNLYKFEENTEQLTYKKVNENRQTTVKQLEISQKTIKNDLMDYERPDSDRYRKVLFQDDVEIQLAKPQSLFFLSVMLVNHLNRFLSRNTVVNQPPLTQESWVASLREDSSWGELNLSLSTLIQHPRRKTAFAQTVSVLDDLKRHTWLSGVGDIAKEETYFNIIKWSEIEPLNHFEDGFKYPLMGLNPVYAFSDLTLLKGHSYSKAKINLFKTILKLDKTTSEKVALTPQHGFKSISYSIGSGNFGHMLMQNQLRLGDLLVKPVTVMPKLAETIIHIKFNKSINQKVIQNTNWLSLNIGFDTEDRENISKYNEFDHFNESNHFDEFKRVNEFKRVDEFERVNEFKRVDEFKRVNELKKVNAFKRFNVLLEAHSSPNVLKKKTMNLPLYLMRRHEAQLLLSFDSVAALKVMNKNLHASQYGFVASGGSPYVGAEKHVDDKKTFAAMWRDKVVLKNAHGNIKLTMNAVHLQQKIVPKGQVATSLTDYATEISLLTEELEKIPQKAKGRKQKKAAQKMAEKRRAIETKIEQLKLTESKAQDEIKHSQEELIPVYIYQNSKMYYKKLDEVATRQRHLHHKSQFIKLKKGSLMGHSDKTARTISRYKEGIQKNQKPMRVLNGVEIAFGHAVKSFSRVVKSVDGFQTSAILVQNQLSKRDLNQIVPFIGQLTNSALPHLMFEPSILAHKTVEREIIREVEVASEAALEVSREEQSNLKTLETAEAVLPESINLDKIADKVYKRVTDQIERERRRRGL